jgi:hypothetical protein
LDELLGLVFLELGAGFEPAAEDEVFPAPLLVAEAPFVHVGVGRLDENQAFQRLIFVGPGRLALQQLIVVGFEVVSKQRQAEVASTLEAAVARPPVAPQPAEQRADVLLEVGLLGDGFRGEPFAYGRKCFAFREGTAADGDERYDCQRHGCERHEFPEVD